MVSLETIKQYVSDIHGSILLIGGVILAIIQSLATKKWDAIFSYSIATIIVLLTISLIYLRNASNRQKVLRILGSPYNALVVAVNILMFVFMIAHIGTSVCLLSRRYNASFDETILLSRLEIQRSTLFQVSLITLAGISIILCVIGIFKSRASMRLFLLSCIATFALLSADYAIYNQKPFIKELLLNRMYEKSLDRWNDNDYSTALNDFSRIYAADPESDIADNALGRVSGAFYNQNDYRDAIETSAMQLAKYPKSDIRNDIVITLHWSIYRGCINKLLDRQRVCKAQISERTFGSQIKTATYVSDFIYT